MAALLERVRRKSQQMTRSKSAPTRSRAKPCSSSATSNARRLSTDLRTSTAGGWVWPPGRCSAVDALTGTPVALEGDALPLTFDGMTYRVIEVRDQHFKPVSAALAETRLRQPNRPALRHPDQPLRGYTSVVPSAATSFSLRPTSAPKTDVAWSYVGGGREVRPSNSVRWRTGAGRWQMSKRDCGFAARLDGHYFQGLNESLTTRWLATPGTGLAGETNAKTTVPGSDLIENHIQCLIDSPRGGTHIEAVDHFLPIQADAEAIGPRTGFPLAANLSRTE